jgi:hypothetical protein
MEYLIFKQLVDELTKHGILGFSVMFIGAAVTMLWRRIIKEKKEREDKEDSTAKRDTESRIALTESFTEISGTLKSISNRLEAGDQKMDKIDSTLDGMQRDLGRLEGAKG